MMMGAILFVLQFVLVEIFRLFNYAVCANIKMGYAGVQ